MTVKVLQPVFFFFRFYVDLNIKHAYKFCVEQLLNMNIVVL